MDEINTGQPQAGLPPEQPAGAEQRQSARDAHDFRTDLKVYFNRLDKKLDSVKAELKEDIKRLALTAEKIQSRAGRVEERAAEKDDINRILNAIDKLAADAEFYRKKDALRANLSAGHEDRLKAHESRISFLESGR